MSKNQIYTVNGFTGNIAQIAKHFNINEGTTRARLKNGMSIEEAVVKKPVRVKYTVNGFAGNLDQIAEHFDIACGTLYSRLRKGMSIEEAISTPINKSRYKPKIYTVNGFTGSIPKIAEHFDISYHTLQNRLQKGMTIEEAINMAARFKTYTVNGFTGNIAQIARHFKMNKTTIRGRLRKGMSIEEAVSIPLRKIRIKNIEYNGETGNLRYFCQKYNKDYIEVYNKLKHLHTLEYALESTNKPYDE